MTGRERFNWEEMVSQDRDLQQIDAFVQLIVSRLPGQPHHPRADIARGGSRFQPASPVKPPYLTTAVSSNGPVPQFINPRDYHSESSSEIDHREVNPMDELSDFESEMLHGNSDQKDEQQEDQMMEIVRKEEEAQEKMIMCGICKKSDSKSEMLTCQNCATASHCRCVDSSLSSLPHMSQSTWWCHQCRVDRSTATTVTVTELPPFSGSHSDNIATTNTVTVPTTMRRQRLESDHGSTKEVAAVSIAQVLGGDPDKSNMLLIHACNCDQAECTDYKFRAICLHMKRFLRSVCWASHSDKWRSYRLAQITTELFAYHAMKCNVSQCNVPLCVKIREEEIV